MFSSKEYESNYKQVRIKNQTHKRILTLGKPTEKLDDIITQLLDIAEPVLAERRKQELLTA